MSALTYDEIRARVLANPQLYAGWLVEIVIDTDQMRAAQKTYFDRKSTYSQKNDALILSKRLERQVDARTQALWDEMESGAVQQPLIGDDDAR